MLAERRQNAGEIIVGDARPGRWQRTKPVDFHFFNLCLSVSLCLSIYRRDTETQRLSFRPAASGLRWTRKDSGFDIDRVRRGPTLPPPRDFPTRNRKPRRALQVSHPRSARSHERRQTPTENLNRDT